MLSRDAAAAAATWRGRRCATARATTFCPRNSQAGPSRRAAAAESAAAAAPGDHYSVLGLSYDVDRAAIRAAFRERAKQLHPDVNAGDDAAFRTLKRAHEVLSDSLLRAAYDASLQDALAGAGSSEAASALRARDPRFARRVLFLGGAPAPCFGSVRHSVHTPKTDAHSAAKGPHIMPPCHTQV
jgi:DnaJ-domain-containing protein 1